MSATPDRETFLTRVRLHHALLALGSVHFDAGDGFFELEGDAATGSFTFDDGFGDRHAVVWNQLGLVALEYFQEIPEGLAMADASPWRFLRALPDELRPLAASAFERCDQRVNSGLWLCGDRCHRQTPHGLALTAYLSDDEGARAPWSEELSEAQAKLALRIVASTRHKLSVADREVALQDPRGGDASPDEGRIASAAAQLGKLGVTWPGLERTLLRARAARSIKRARLQSPADKALLDAIIAGDFVAACAAFEAGASVNCVTLEDQYFGEPEGATPLLLALQHKHDDLAELLIASGADLDRSTHHGQWPLLLAATRGNAAMCRRLLERGAQPSRPGPGWGVLEHIAHDHPEWSASSKAYAEVVGVLLDAGAPLPATPYLVEVLVELVERGGRPELAARLRA